MRMRLQLTLALVLAAFFACTDPAANFAATMAGADRLLELYAEVRGRPRNERGNRELAGFLGANAARLGDGLEALGKLRAGEPAVFWRLYAENKPRIVATLRRLELIDRRERLLFGILPLVLVPEETETDKSRLEFELALFRSWCQLLERDARAMAR